MKRENCEACGKLIGKSYAVDYALIPDEVAKMHGIRALTTVRVCLQCARELPGWCLRSASNVIYDHRSGHFRNRTAEELAEEYRSAFRGYAHFKKRQEK